MRLANRNAERRKHEYIGTEHLLLGMLSEEETVARNVLAQQGVDAESARAKILEV